MIVHDVCTRFHREVSEAFNSATDLRVGRLEDVVKRALKAGCEQPALVALQMLATEYEAVQNGSARRQVVASIRDLERRVMPSVMARLELRRVFGIDPAADFSGQAADLPHRLYEASFIPELDARVSRLQALRDEAIADEKGLEALLANLMLVGDFARAGKLRAIVTARREVRRLEASAEIRKRLEAPFTPRIDALFAGSASRSMRRGGQKRKGPKS